MPCAHRGKGAGKGALPPLTPHPAIAGQRMWMRDRSIKVRLTTDELADLRARATGRGLSLSELLRRAGAGVRMPARAFDRTHALLMTRALGELGRIGGNLNQLSRAANKGHVPHGDDIRRTLDGINQLREQIRVLLS